MNTRERTNRKVELLTQKLFTLMDQESAIFFAQRPFLLHGGEVVISDNPALIRKQREVAMESQKIAQELSRLLTPPKVTYVQPSITGI